MRAVPDDCLVLCRDNLTDYYGCFRSSPLLYQSQKNCVVNFHDTQIIQSYGGIGKTLASKIIGSRPIKTKKQLEALGVPTHFLASASLFPYGIESSSGIEPEGSNKELHDLFAENMADSRRGWSFLRFFTRRKKSPTSSPRG